MQEIGETINTGLLGLLATRVKLNIEADNLVVARTPQGKLKVAPEIEKPVNDLLSRGVNKERILEALYNGVASAEEPAENIAQIYQKYEEGKRQNFENLAEGQKRVIQDAEMFIEDLAVKRR